MYPWHLLITRTLYCTYGNCLQHHKMWRYAKNVNFWLEDVNWIEFSFQTIPCLSVGKQKQTKLFMTNILTGINRSKHMHSWWSILLTTHTPHISHTRPRYPHTSHTPHQFLLLFGPGLSVLLPSLVILTVLLLQYLCVCVCVCVGGGWV